jgi:hypothetical protein
MSYLVKTPSGKDLYFKNRNELYNYRFNITEHYYKFENAPEEAKQSLYNRYLESKEKNDRDIFSYYYRDFNSYEEFCERLRWEYIYNPDPSQQENWVMGFEKPIRFESRRWALKSSGYRLFREV